MNAPRSSTPLLVSLLGLILEACGGSASPSGSCIPGQSVACVGPAGCTGGQTCAADGRSFGACLCEPGGQDADTPTSDSSVGAADGPVTPSDAGPDAPTAPPPDAAAVIPDAALGLTDGGKGALVIAPASNDFGTTAVAGAGSTITFTVRNAGDGPISGLMIAVNGADFAIPMGGSRCGPALDAGSSCLVDVQFAPKQRGNRIAYLVVTGMAGQTAIDATAELSGKAQIPAKLIVNPAALSFAAPVGQSSATVTLTLANAGDAQSGVPSVSLGGTNATDWKIVDNGCITPLAANDSCAVGLAFKPASAGPKAAVLTLSATPGGMAESSLMGTAN
jgi:hypothetical protein